MSATPELINVIFYVIMICISVLFSLLAFTFRVKDTDPDSRWLGPIFAVISFVCWTVSGAAHLSVAASFSQELIVLAYLWYGFAVFFLIYTVVLIFQTIRLSIEEKKWQV